MSPLESGALVRTQHRQLTTQEQYETDAINFRYLVGEAKANPLWLSFFYDEASHSGADMGGGQCA